MSQKVLLQADYLLNWDGQPEIIPQGELVIEDGLIVYAGPARNKHDEAYIRKIEGKNKLVMPGFINTHTHAAMSLFRGYADDMPLKDWLENKIWPVEAKLKKKDIYWGTLLSICEMIRGGTTCFADMYFHMEQVARACLESGIRASLSQGLVGLDLLKGLGGLKEGKKLAKNWHGKGEGRITVMLGPHAPYTCPPKYLQEVADTAGSLNIPIHIHLSETREEVEESIKLHGKRPVELMEQIGLFEQNVLAVHCVHLSGEEIEIMARRKVAVAHNPGSNLKLGSGVAPLADLLKNGVLVSLGTDGAASNNNLDMMEEMRLAALIPKGFAENPTLITAAEALKIATVNGAKALYLQENVGTLSKGSKADLIMLDLNSSHLHPLHSIPAQLVYAALSSDVELVMVDGNILMEKGDLKTLDEERIVYETEKISSRLLK